MIILCLERLYRKSYKNNVIKSVILGIYLFIILLIVHRLFNPLYKYKNYRNLFSFERYHEVKRICEYLFKNPVENSSHGVVESIQTNWNQDYSSLSNPSTCKEFKLFQGYTVHSSMEEEQFPLAFSLSVHENIRQVSRLLRLIYRPQNLYCIHVDSKSPQQFYDEVMEMAKCFGSNVMVVNRSESVDVQWGYYSILEVFLLCADKLMKNTKYMWKYILNVSGQELPLRTNWELVAALKAINGSNVVEGLGPRHNPSRWPQKNFSFPIIWNKGSFYMALKREFVHFYQTDSKANEILNAIKAERHLQKHPDELFFPTLTHNPKIGAPGACKEIHETDYSDPRKRFVARYVTWFEEGCKSSRVRRAVCIIGAANLPYIPSRLEFFANKFHADFEPIAYDCTEYYIMKKVLKEMRTNRLDPNFNLTHYTQLHCSQNHI
ncbi:unnamed protein product [Heterobilharzia americana]|nr:unnamed protein product [Heterobilharzia americana]CAH8456907.1 unnamed protein product [Heterobilharzia americana]